MKIFHISAVAGWVLKMIWIILLSLGADLGEGCGGSKGNGPGIGKGFCQQCFKFKIGGTALNLTS